MSNVIMMCGCCGSGKTTYSKIKENEGYIRLSIDEMMWNKYGQHGKDFPIEKYRELLDCIEIELKNKLVEIIKIGQDVIIDSSFWNKSNRILYRNLIKETDSNSKIQLIYLKADYDTLHTRLQIRNQEISANSSFIITDEILSHHYYGFQEPIDEDEIIILQK